MKWDLKKLETNIKKNLKELEPRLIMKLDGIITSLFTAFGILMKTLGS